MTQSVVFIKQAVRCDSQLYLFSRLSGVTQSVVFIQQALRRGSFSCI